MVDGTVQCELLPDGANVRRQLYGRFMERGAVAESIYGFPSCFVFKSSENHNGRRLESVFWTKLLDHAGTVKNGLEEAAKRRSEERQRDPQRSEEELRVYRGYFQGISGLIRGSGFKGKRSNEGEPHCAAGLFDVEHWPEKGLDAHCHIELLPGYADIIWRQRELDGDDLSGSKREAVARTHAITQLVRVFELAGRYYPDGTAESLQTFDIERADDVLVLQDSQRDDAAQ